ncbi:MAG TPA: PAS domain-containing protein [Alphaproteobacteria bacterium]|nr:PAS domain-containing protein [Alphaproteobacteria bacterium]
MSQYIPRVISDEDFSALHPRFTWMRDYLARVAPPGRLAGRQHVDPLDLKDVLPFINLVDVAREKAGLRFRFRLVGSAQTQMAGREITGLSVEEAVLPDYVDRILSNMRAVVEHKAPVYDRFPTAHLDREYLDSERVYFPLASDGATVDMLILIHAYPGHERSA